MNTQSENNSEIETIAAADLEHVTGGSNFWGTVWEGAKEVGRSIYNHGYETGASCGPA